MNDILIELTIKRKKKHLYTNLKGLFPFRLNSKIKYIKLFPFRLRKTWGELRRNGNLCKH